MFYNHGDREAQRNTENVNAVHTLLCVPPCRSVSVVIKHFYFKYSVQHFAVSPAIFTPLPQWHNDCLNKCH